MSVGKCIYLRSKLPDAGLIEEFEIIDDVYNA